MKLIFSVDYKSNKIQKKLQKNLKINQNLKIIF